MKLRFKKPWKRKCKRGKPKIYWFVWEEPLQIANEKRKTWKAREKGKIQASGQSSKNSKEEDKKAMAINAKNRGKKQNGND